MTDKPLPLFPHFSSLMKQAEQNQHLAGYDQLHAEFSTITSRLSDFGGSILGSGASPKPGPLAQIVFDTPVDSWVQCPFRDCHGKRPK